MQQFNDFSDFKSLLQRQVKKPQIWLRDDDATSASESLDNYLRALRGFPVLMAVIPSLCDDGLAKKLAILESICIAQHGYSHTNHAVANDKKNEFPDYRDIGEIEAELKRGQYQLEHYFSHQFVPVFVPPWNRMSEKLPSLLYGLGFRGVSLYGGSYLPPSSLVRRDSYIDIINWRDNKSFIGEGIIFELMASHIESKSEPLGILTHHRDHDLRSHQFLLDFMVFLQDNCSLIEVINPRRLFSYF